MSRYIDADALPISVAWIEQGSKQEHCAFVFERDIKDAPTVDAVKVVRCKDCVHWEQNEQNDDGICRRLHRRTTPGWYCADGEALG